MWSRWLWWASFWSFIHVLHLAFCVVFGNVFEKLYFKLTENTQVEGLIPWHWGGRGKRIHKLQASLVCVGRFCYKTYTYVHSRWKNWDIMLEIMWRLLRSLSSCSQTCDVTANFLSHQGLIHVHRVGAHCQESRESGVSIPTSLGFCFLKREN